MEGTVAVIGSREFNQDVTRAKRAATAEPVFITDRGRPTHVLVSIETWRQMTGEGTSILELLARPGLPGQASETPAAQTAMWGEY
jgi:prevent-host-death family protein